MTEMLTLGQAAKLAGLSRSTLSQAIKDGRLPALREGDWVYRIDPRDLSRVFLTSASTPSGSIAEVPQTVAPTAAPRDERTETVLRRLEQSPSKPMVSPSSAQPSLVQRLFALMGIGRSARA